MFSSKNLDKGMVPDHIITALETIGNQGFHAVIIGGAVRDMLIGQVPSEYDLATSALPEDIEKIFEKTTPVGKPFGTIIVHLGPYSVEITTYRKESQYTDFRHPKNVEFSNSIFDDLARRDFTINAMAYNPITNEFIDQFDGLTHLNDRRLVCVGDPNVRFVEDTLRPFRCFRFMAQFGFIIDPSIRLALDALNQLPFPATERIRQEMDRLLMAPYWFSALNLMHQTGWLNRLVPIDCDFPTEADIDRRLLFRWAWLISLSSKLDIADRFQFSKQDQRQLELIQTWKFDSFAIDLTVNDLNIRSDQLIEIGYSGQDLGQLQQQLLDKVRRRELYNSERDIKDYVYKLKQG